MDFVERLLQIKKQFEEIEKKLSDPDIISNQEKYTELSKKHSSLLPVVKKINEYLDCKKSYDEAKEIIENENDEELITLAKEDIKEKESFLSKLEKEIKLLLLPEDPRDKANIIVEIRAGTGGEEAALFAADLFKMYSRYAEKKKWKVEIINANTTDLGGYKEIIFSVSGNKVYSRMKYESGVHRVQRVPQTESQGRLHTSAVTVAVLPEPEDIEIEIKPEELRIDVFRASGHGGQHVNKTESAVRITHLPTGIVVSCQDEKSQLKNKQKAMKVLRARLYDMKMREQQAKISAERKSQIGTGDRSERIRTYNFPQNRITDHRINLTLYKLDQVLLGDLDEIIDSLNIYFQTKRMEEEFGKS